MFCNFDKFCKILLKVTLIVNCKIISCSTFKNLFAEIFVDIRYFGAFLREQNADPPPSSLIENGQIELLVPKDTQSYEMYVCKNNFPILFLFNEIFILSFWALRDFSTKNLIFLRFRWFKLWSAYILEDSKKKKLTIFFSEILFFS